MNYENMQQKIDVLKTVYGAMHEHIRTNEALENRVAFSVGTLFMLFTAFVLKENIHPNLVGKAIIASMILLIAIVTVAFIMNNNNRIKYQCKIVVRVEKAFGFYENKLFIDWQGDDEVYDKSDGLFPKDAKNWGLKQKRLFLFPHILGVIFSGIAAITSLFMELSK